MPMLDPGTSPSANPPAIVETYTQAQLDAMKGNLDAPGQDKDALRHALALAAKDDGPARTPSTSTSAATGADQQTERTGPPALDHNPWSRNRRQEQVNQEIKHASEDPATHYKPPANIQAMLDAQADRDRSDLVRRLHISAVRADAGLGSVDRDAIVRLQSLSPESVEKAVVENMERKLVFLKPGDSLPVSTNNTPVELRLTADQTAALLRMRDEYRMSGDQLKGLDPKEVAERRANYVKICEHFMVRDMNGVHQGLLEHAFKGFDARGGAQAVREIFENRSMTDHERKLALNSEISRAGPGRFGALMTEYSMLPEREMGKSLYVALEKRDSNAIRSILAGRSAEDCYRLEERANQHAEANGLKKAGDLIATFTSSKDKAVAAEYQRAMRGFDAKSHAHDAYVALDRTNVDEAGVRSALSEIKNDKGETQSALTAAQIAAVRKEVGEIAKERGKDAEKYMASFDRAAKGVGDKPTTEITPQRGDFRADAAKSGLKLDEVMDVTLLATTYNFDATETTLQLRKAVEEFNGSDPTKTNPDNILQLLKFGSDPGRTHYLSHSELTIAIQAYDSQRPEGPTLRETLANKLSGDARVQALQIVDQGFYASREAEALQVDMRRLLHIGNGVDTNQALVDRIVQTDKEYRLRSGKSLVEGIAETTLDDKTKAALTAVAMIPTLDTLRDELRKPSPSTDVIDRLIQVKDIEPIYNAVYSKEPADLRGTLEALGRSGKLSRDFVMEQECVLSGIARDTFTKLDAELRSDKPAIGTKDSVLRGKTEAQMLFIQHGFEYREEQRAAARNETPMSLVEHIAKLNDEAKISVDQVQRAAMMLNGNDPFMRAEGIRTALIAALPAGADEAAQKELALAKVREITKLLPQDGADPLVAQAEANQIRKVYEEEYSGQRILQGIVADKNIRTAFKNEAEQNVWTDSIAATLYPGKGEIIGPMMRAGNDPWVLSADLSVTLAKQPAAGANDTELKAHAMAKVTAIAVLAPSDAMPPEIKLNTPNLDFQQAQIVREIYAQTFPDRDGGVILRGILADKSLPKGLDNDPDQVKYGKLVDGIARNMYGEGMADIVLDMEATISSIRQANDAIKKSSTMPGLPQEELDKMVAQRDALYPKLKGNLEAAAGWRYLANESEMYSVFFGPTIEQEVETLAMEGAISKAQRDELAGIMSPK